MQYGLKTKFQLLLQATRLQTLLFSLHYLDIRATDSVFDKDPTGQKSRNNSSCKGLAAGKTLPVTPAGTPVVVLTLYRGLSLNPIYYIYSSAQCRTTHITITAALQQI